MTDKFQEVHHKLLPNADFEQNMEFLHAWKDQQYLARLEAKREQILFDMQKSKIPESEDVFLPLPTLADEKHKLGIVKSRTKVKIRGETHQTPDDARAEDQEAVQHDPPPVSTIYISKRSYATFRYMYPDAPEERQKSIDWNTFVDSMMDAGFVVRNGGGSIVTFEDKRGGGKIIFHRPHPEPRIDPIMLQSMGNRLNRWFGWGRETFVVEKKGGGEGRGRGSWLFCSRS